MESFKECAKASEMDWNQNMESCGEHFSLAPAVFACLPV